MADSESDQPANTSGAAAAASGSRAADYAHSLLRISVPVHVKLASQRTSIQEIIELGPGSIVKFEKTCDQPLELVVGDRTIAEGEVVKIGDKFGVRIRGLVK